MLFTTKALRTLTKVQLDRALEDDMVTRKSYRVEIIRREKMKQFALLSAGRLMEGKTR